MQPDSEDLRRRIGALLTAFRSETGITLPDGYGEGPGDKLDTPDGALGWWCLRNPGLLEQHGLWMAHPAATVIPAWARARDEGGEPAPWCEFQRAPHLERIYFPDEAGKAGWAAFQAAGGHAGMTFAGWRVLGRDAPTDAPEQPARRWR